MSKDVYILSDEYKKGFGDAIFHVIRIINDNSNLQQQSLIALLNKVVIEVNKNDIK